VPSADRPSRKDARPGRGRDDRREPRGARLDVPLDTRRAIVRRPQVDSDTFGRFAETFARFMGTARFLIYMTLFVAVWLGFNSLAPRAARFDGYPFIFLTLMLSLQASYAAPLILLAQNRQEDRDRVIGEQDRTANARAHADMEFLAREISSIRMALGDVATRDYVRSELRSLVQEIDDQRSRADGRGDGRGDGRRDGRGDRHDADGDRRDAAGQGPAGGT
jgi:uncharacterized membrane protein